MSEETKADRYLKNLKNKKIIAILVVAGVAVLATAAVLKATYDTWQIRPWREVLSINLSLYNNTVPITADKAQKSDEVNMTK